MADHGQLKVKQDIDSVDDDPLAELTRIMGLAPDGKTEDQQFDDFGIDLEQELLGAFDAEAPSDAAAPDQSALAEPSIPAASPEEIDQSGSEVHADPLDQAMEAEFSSMLEDELASDGLVSEPSIGQPTVDEATSAAGAAPTDVTAFDAAQPHEDAVAPEDSPALQADEEFLDLDLDFDAGLEGRQAEPHQADVAAEAEPAWQANAQLETGEAAQAASAAESPEAMPAPSLEDELAALLGGNLAGPPVSDQETSANAGFDEQPAAAEALASEDRVAGEAEDALSASHHTPNEVFGAESADTWPDTWNGDSVADPLQTAPPELSGEDALYRGVESTDPVDHAASFPADEPAAELELVDQAALNEPHVEAEPQSAQDPFAELAAMAEATASRASIGYGSLTRRLREEAREPAPDDLENGSVASDEEHEPDALDVMLGQQPDYDGAHRRPASEEAGAASLDAQDWSSAGDPLPQPMAEAEVSLPDTSDGDRQPGFGDMGDPGEPVQTNRDEPATFDTRLDQQSSAFDDAHLRTEPGEAPAGAHYEQSWPDAGDPFHQPAAEAAAFAPNALHTDRQSAAEAIGEPGRAEQPTWDDYGPDLETVEIPEGRVELTDELDLPDIGLPDESPPPATDDELELQLASIFDDPQALKPASMGAGVPREEARGIEVAAAAHAGAPIDADAAAAMARTEQAGAHAGLDAGDDWLAADLDDFSVSPSDLEDSAPQPSVAAMDPARQETGHRRGLIVAGLVAGVAIVGGIAAYAFSSGGGGSDGAPVLVKADPDPVKVRPEQPGGVTVPNQDKIVYERVAGGTQDAPTQERLVASSEEPVDLSARGSNQAGEPAATAPQMSESGKSEARILPDDTPPTPVNADEVAAVAPRVVRTMVVKPDGTLVPREEPAAPTPAPQSAAQAMTTDDAAAAPSASDTGSLSNQANAASVDGSSAGDQTAGTLSGSENAADGQQNAANGDPATPDSVPVVPSRPSEQPVDIVGESVQVAATDPSEWSMQIASQPTAEGAQASYANLSQRYASVLNGRGVNIVKAEIEGKGTYYRVRIPAQSRDAAIDLCERYKGAGGNCFVAR
ncbi:SPOR domain-containing protein [Mesorhizobium xinjiangense]|uniref:SPOR domain-containing protein n=1 Tax=Mesorhizobium xinjiangense TaxID=2678685 RepID=UPI0012EDFD88|nr:SPOR domain-containing protein [Mesorhizobium xinjiangense]